MADDKTTNVQHPTRDIGSLSKILPTSSLRIPMPTNVKPPKPAAGQILPKT